MTKTLSFDISTKRTGWAFIDENNHIEFGMIPFSNKVPLRCIMSVLRDSTKWLCFKYNPDVVVVENTHFGVAGIDTLKKLEGCRYSVKRACMDSLSLWPAELWPQTVRAAYEIKTKQEAFDFVKKKFNLHFMDFDLHNDISDAILMSLYVKEKKIACLNGCGIKEELSALLGIIFSKKTSYIMKEAVYKLPFDEEDITHYKYYGLGSLCDCPIVYNNKGQCKFYFCDVYYEDSWFSISSLYYIFLDSLKFKNKFYYFEVNSAFKNDFDGILSSPTAADWAGGIKKLKTRYKISKESFDKNILPALKKSIGYKKIKFLMDKVLKGDK